MSMYVMVLERLFAVFFFDRMAKAVVVFFACLFVAISVEGFSKLDDETYELILSILKKTFHVPVKDRTTKQKMR